MAIQTILFDAAESIKTIGKMVEGFDTDGKYLTQIFLTDVVSLEYLPATQEFRFTYETKRGGDDIIPISGPNHIVLKEIQFDKNGVSLSGSLSGRTDNCVKGINNNSGNMTLIPVDSIVYIFHDGTSGDGSIAIGYVDQNPVLQSNLNKRS